MTKELEELLHKNDVIIHSEYDSYAGKFAKAYKLKFILADIILTEYKNADEPFEKIILILKFNIEGKYWIFEETIQYLGGGEVNYDIPKGFFNKIRTIEKFTEHFSKCYREILLNNENFQRFFKKLNE